MTPEQERVYHQIISLVGIKPNAGQDQLMRPIETAGGAKACLAVPGSGKTTAMTLAVIHEELVNRTPAKYIRCITFTNKGADEFAARHARYLNMLQAGLKSLVNVSTINSMCKHYVEVFYDKLGMPKAELLDEDDAHKRLGYIIGIVLGVQREKVSSQLIKDVTSVISYLNNKMYYTYEEVVKTYQFMSLKLEFSKFNSIRELYRSYMRENGRLDHDEFMACFYEILATSDSVRGIIQNEIRVLYVDEFQDTSKLQFEIIKLLKGPNCCIKVVGDQDQSIYRWRGASDVYQDFFAAYPNAQIVKMDINYRCPDIVIQVANNLIRNNTGRIEVTSKGTGKKGRLVVEPCIGNKQAADIIANEIITAYEHSNRDNFALMKRMVLYRNHSQAMFLVYGLAQKRVPVLASGITLLHNDKMVKDLMDIVAFLQNPRNSQLASNSMFKVSTQIRKPKSSDQCSFARSGENEHFAQVRVSVNKPDVYRKELERLVKAAELVRTNGSARDIFMLLIPMYREAYYDYICQMQGKPAEDVDAVADFLTTGVDKSYDMDQFRYLLNMSAQFVRESNSDKIGVRVYSMHGAKGLESPIVYLLDCNGGTQPNSKVIKALSEAKSWDALEEFINEERSLFYVGITRALEELWVTYNKDNPSPFNLESGLNEKLILSRKVISIEKFRGNRESVQTPSDPFGGLMRHANKENHAPKEIVGNTVIQSKVDAIGVPAMSDKSLTDMLTTLANELASETTKVMPMKSRNITGGNHIIDSIVG